MTFDHGELNIPLAGKRGRALDAEITREVEKQRREEITERKAAAKARREAEAARVRLTREDIEGARVAFIKDLGWKRVTQVNEKTITVPTEFGQLRFSFTDVLEVGK